MIDGDSVQPALCQEKLSPGGRRAIIGVKVYPGSVASSSPLVVVPPSGVRSDARQTFEKKRNVYDEADRSFEEAGVLLVELN